MRYYTSRVYQVRRPSQQTQMYGINLQRQILPDHAVEVTVTNWIALAIWRCYGPQIALYKQVGTCPSATFELVDDEYSALGAPFYEKWNSIV